MLCQQSLFTSLTLAVLAIFSMSSKETSDASSDNNNSEETEHLIQNDETRVAGKSGSLKRLLAESIPDLHLLCLAFI